MGRVRAIIPRPFNSGALVREMQAAMNGFARVVESDFQETVQTWEHKPHFEVTILLIGPRWKAEVSTDDEIYGYVSHGTDPHVIRVKNAKALAFPTGYVAKTVPGVIPSRPGGASGDTAYAKEVQHPGTDPRNFARLISLHRNKELKQRMEAAIRAGARATGYSK